jgi:hypothetical protein
MHSQQWEALSPFMPIITQWFAVFHGDPLEKISTFLTNWQKPGRSIN